MPTSQHDLAQQQGTLQNFQTLKFFRDWRGWTNSAGNGAGRALMLHPRHRKMAA
jgi:hypothetical protein